MKALITGGAGYIGRHLANMMVKQGQTVVVLDLQTPDPARVLPGCTFLQGSINDPSIVQRAVQGMDVVFHLAWGSYPQDERREVRENLLGTLALLQASRAAGVGHLVFASSAVVYGPTGPRRVSEGHACFPERTIIGGPVYGITKLAGEKCCLACERGTLPATVLRIHGVFSAGRLSKFEQMIHMARRGGPVQAVRGAGGEYVHLEDVLAILRLVAGNRNAFGQVFNVAGLHTYHDNELAQQIASAAGCAMEQVENSRGQIVSVSVQKLRRTLGYQPKREAFLEQLVQERLTGTPCRSS
jgi:nucleoside-diphosphate-sugar epimerase